MGSMSGQSIDGLSSSKIIVFHFFIRKSGNDGWKRRCGPFSAAVASVDGVIAAGRCAARNTSTAKLKVKLEMRRILYKNTDTCSSIQWRS
jgi:hypothetical protein